MQRLVRNWFHTPLDIPFSAWDLFGHAGNKVRPLATSIATLALLALTGMAGGLRAQARPSGASADTARQQMDMEVPHAFFTHEGLPEASGALNLRTAGLLRRAGGQTEGDFAFHLETRLTRTVGLHVRNDEFRASPRTEAMFQFPAFTSKDGQSGFAPIIEFELPTRGAAQGINTLVGQTVKLASGRVAFNEVVHYNPRENGVDWSTSLVVATLPRLFPVVEALGSGMRGQAPVVNLLAGLKVRLREGLLLGAAYEFPVTTSKDFASKLVFQPDIEWSVR